MTKRRAHIDLVVDTQAHADTIVQVVKDQLISQGGIFFKDSDGKIRIDEDNIIHATGQIRFTSIAKANEFRDWAKDQAQNSAAKDWILSGSSVKLHTCSHDDDQPNEPCVEDEIWSKP